MTKKEQLRELNKKMVNTIKELRDLASTEPIKSMSLDMRKQYSLAVKALIDFSDELIIKYLMD